MSISDSPKSVNRSFEQELLEAISHLRAYARSLTRNRDEADDLVQDAVTRALSAQSQFTIGTNFRAWMFTILRNLFYNRQRTNGRSFVPIDTLVANEPSTRALQEDGLAVSDFRRSFYRLSPQYREVLTLVGASGLSYEETAKICNCQVGTIKSRVFRARAQLAELLNEDTGAQGSITSDKNSPKGMPIKRTTT